MKERTQGLALSAEGQKRLDHKEKRIEDCGVLIHNLFAEKRITWHNLYCNVLAKLI